MSVRPFFLQRDSASLLRGLGNDSSGVQPPTLQTAPIIWGVVNFGLHQTLELPSLPCAAWRSVIPAPVPALQCAAFELQSVRELHVWLCETSIAAWCRLEPLVLNTTRPISGAVTIPGGSRPWGGEPTFRYIEGFVGNGGVLPTNLDSAQYSLAISRGFNRIPKGHRLTVSATVPNVAMTVNLIVADIGPVLSL